MERECDKEKKRTQGRSRFRNHATCRSSASHVTTVIELIFQFLSPFEAVRENLDGWRIFPSNLTSHVKEEEQNWI